MSLFPIVADQVQLSTDAPVPTDCYARGVLCAADNSVARAALSGGVQWSNGLLMTALGQVVIVDATAGLPAGTQYVNGLPISPAGALCVSGDAMVNYSNGLPFAANGALSGFSLASQVAALFAAMSGPKLWLDPSDPATRFQDQAGTTLVTADGQPYGRANDKSGGIANDVGQVTTTSRPLWRTDGVLSWAQADGVDDSWQSLANFDCTSTDKITVIAGVRKEIDSTTRVLLELGPNYSANDGSIAVFAPSTASSGEVLVASRGTVNRLAGVVGQPANTQVWTGVSDIAAPLLALRINGLSVAASNLTQGLGSFRSDLLNIFRRNNANLPFGGRLYGLMIFGRLLTADELSLCERYMAQKSGVTL